MSQYYGDDGSIKTRLTQVGHWEVCPECLKMIEEVIFGWVKEKKYKKN